MIRTIIFACFLCLGFPISLGEYTADWDSLDSRELPQWYDDAKIGIFLHWGLYSVPSFGSEWFWQNWQGSKVPKYIKFMEENYRPGFTYQDFGPEFTAEFYEPDFWADLFEDAGAKYIVLTSKHHEGFTLWPSKYSWGWNAMDLGPQRDLLGDLASAIRKRTSIRFGLYHSLYEWFNPLYLQDKNNSFKTDSFVTSKTMPELYELVESYQPEIIWSDGEWEADDEYWNSKEFIAWLFNESPVNETVVVNDRWGSGDLCKHGSFYTCTDRYNPGVLQPHKWENCLTIDKKSWGYRREAVYSDYLTIEEILGIMAATISCGGNYLINTGPTHDGRIAPIMEERLRHMGQWLSLNGEAIYSSRPWIYQNDTLTSGVWYTKSGDSVYAIVLSWPTETGDVLTLGSITENEIDTSVTAYMLGYSEELQTKMSVDGLQITFPSLSSVQGRWAWVLKFSGLKLQEEILINNDDDDDDDD